MACGHAQRNGKGDQGYAAAAGEWFHRAVARNIDQRHSLDSTIVIRDAYAVDIFEIREF
jgi:hypothetical protein